jgi:hypothetical protein
MSAASAVPPIPIQVLTGTRLRRLDTVSGPSGEPDITLLDY